MMWKEIKTDEDITELMETCGYFHDSCIVSMNYQNGAFVDENSSMHFGTAEDRVLNVFFHSQWEPEKLELCFSGVRQMHIVGWQDNYVCDIFEAGLSFFEGLLPGKPEKLIVWSDCGEFDPPTADAPLQEPATTYIMANSLKWRIID